MYFIIGGDGKTYGPITEGDLRKWIAEGRLNAQSQARSESEAEFRALGTFPEFASSFGAGAPPPGMPPLVGATSEGYAGAADKVKIPAIGLIVSSSICILEAVWSLIRLPDAAAKMQQIESMYQSNPQAAELVQKIGSFASGPFGYATAILQIVIGILILIGATRMLKLRSYEFAFATAILSVIPCINPCCGWIVSLVFGIWALIILAKSDVRSQFS